MTQQNNVQQLIAKLRTSGRPKLQSLSAVDYDWTKPQKYDSAQRKTLASAAQTLGEKISGALGSLLKCNLTLNARDYTSIYGDDIAGVVGTERFTIALTDDDGGNVGCLAIDKAPAAEWVSKLLGSTGKVEPDRQFSSLELTLLVDIIASIARTLSDELVNRKAKPLNAPSKLEPIAKLRFNSSPDDYLIIPIVAADSPDPGGEQEDHAQNDADQKNDDKKNQQHNKEETAQTGENEQQVADKAEDPKQARLQSDILMVLNGELADVLAGDARRPPLPPAEARKLMISHVHRVPMRLNVLLGEATLTMGEIMNLQSDDVLILDSTRSVLRANDVVIASGSPVRCSDTYGMLLEAMT